MPFPYNDLGVGTRHCRLLRDTSQDTAMPFPYNDLGVGTRHCRLLRDTSQDTAMPFPYNGFGGRDTAMPSPPWYKSGHGNAVSLQ